MEKIFLYKVKFQSFWSKSFYFFHLSNVRDRTIKIAVYKSKSEFKKIFLPPKPQRSNFPYLKKKKGKKEIWSKYNCNAKLQIHFAGKEIEEREYIKKTFQRFCWISKACKSAPSLILEISSTKDSLLNVWLCTILLRGVRMKSMDSRYRDNRAPLIKKDKMAISVNIGAARSANICRRTFQPALSPSLPSLFCKFSPSMNTSSFLVRISWNLKRHFSNDFAFVSYVDKKIECGHEIVFRFQQFASPINDSLSLYKSFFSLGSFLSVGCSSDRFSPLSSP